MLPHPDFPEPAPLHGEAVRILLLEDDPVSVEIVGTYLRRIAFADSELHSAASLADALALLANVDVDLVISDLNLPDSAGPATIERLVETVGCPVIAITSDRDSALREATLARGAYDFVQKSNLTEPALQRLVRLAAMQARSFRSLRESEARFRSLSALTSDWFWETDAEHRFVSKPSGVTAVTGLGAEAYVGKTRWEVAGLAPLSGDWRAHRQELARHASFRDLELVQVRADGSRCYLQISGEPAYQKDGTFKGYHGTAKDVTARIRAEEALRASESRLRAILSNEPQCVKLLDGEGRLVDMNPAGLRMIEADDIEPLRGQCVYGLVASEHRDAFRELTQRVARGEQGALEFELIGLKGARRWLETRAVPLRDDASGKPLVLGITRDVTEHRRAEVAMRASEERFRQTFELAGSGMAHVSLDGRFLRVNRSLCRTLGYPAQELVGRSVKEISHPEDRDATDAARRHVRNGEADYIRAQKRYLRKDGATVWVELTVALARDDDGNPLYEITVLEDITDRKNAESALRESEARFRTLTELTSDWYWEQDAEFRFVSTGGASDARGGITAKEHVGLRRWELPGTEIVGQSWKEHRAVLESHAPFRDLLLRRTAPGGAVHYISVAGQPLFDARHAFAGYRGVAKDITPHMEAQVALRESEARFRSLTELTTDWYWEQDEELRFIKFESAEDDSQLRADLGLLRWESEGVDLSAPYWAPHIALLRRRERFHDFEYSVQRADGSREYFRTSGYPVFDGAGRFRGYRGVARNITEARRGEEDLHRFRAALDAAGDMVFLVDARTSTYLDFNQTACRRLGYQRDEMLGMQTQRVRVDRTHEQLLEDYRGLGEASATSIGTYRRKDGSEFPVEVTRRLLETRDGAVVVATARDLTERMQAEQALAAHLRYQERVARFGQSALVKSEPTELIEKAVQAVLEALGAEAVAYLEREPGAGGLVLRAVVGVADGGAVSGPVACGRGDPLLQVMRSGNRLLTDGAKLPLAWARELRTAAIIPVRSDDKVRGVLCVGYPDADAFGAEELNFVEAIASVLSTALQRIDSEARLAYLAQFDPLTGLPNRTLLADRFSQMIAQAQRRSSPLVVLFIDLDEFKVVNDTLGHAGGDALLKEVAARLQSTVRPGDTVARISGDEFAIVLADMAHAEDAALVAQKVIDRLAAAVEIEGKEVFVTASAGIAAFPADGADAEALLGAADAAMYRAKQAGRNTYQFFTAEINQRSRARARLGSELRRALEREEFTLFYQPKVELASRRTTGAEALLRWKHPERGLVSPMEFIPVLEEIGLIVPVGEWVIGRACEDLKAWQGAGLTAVPVSVNLSARQFRLPDLDARIRSLVSGAGVDPGLIELEITESQLIPDPDQAIRVMRALREAGMRIAIDDFGTGYSSLAYLHRFPVSALKIDRSFVKDMAKGRDDATLVRTIIEMAHSLGFTVVAEGVETEEQAAFLHLLRCEQAQGYLFARPMPAADFVKLLARR